MHRCVALQAVSRGNGMCTPTPPWRADARPGRRGACTPRAAGGAFAAAVCADAPRRAVRRIRTERASASVAFIVASAFAIVSKSLSLSARPSASTARHVAGAMRPTMPKSMNPTRPSRSASTLPACTSAWKVSQKRTEPVQVLSALMSVASGSPVDTDWIACREGGWRCVLHSSWRCCCTACGRYARAPRKAREQRAFA